MLERELSAYKVIVNKNFDVSNFIERIIMQKIIFLLSVQNMRFSENYRFYWDEFGPFSIDLNVSLKTNEKNEELNSLPFNEMDNRKIQILKKKIDYFLNGNKELNKLLDVVEIFASLYYIYRVEYYDADDCSEKLIERKSRFKAYDVKEMFEHYFASDTLGEV